MTRRQFAPLLTWPALAAAPRRPNVVFVITDDQGYGDLSVHGSTQVKTPHIDSLARDGVQFTQFHSSPVCSPTRASLMTGRYNYRTGVVDTYIGRSMMRPGEATMAESFRAAGYRTSIFGKWHLGDHYPLRAMDRGFDDALVHFGGGIGQPSDPPGGESYFDPLLQRNGVAERHSGYCTDIFFEEAARFIERHRRRPFFAYIATNSPHTPLEVAESAIEPFRRAGIEERNARLFAMVENLDANIGRLLGRMARAGVERNTIVVFMTDNGPQWPRYNAGMRGVKGTVYEGGIRVPCFLRWPGQVAAGTQADRLAAHIDLFPTLAEACGVALPTARPLDGRSLWPLAKGGSPSKWRDRTLAFQWHRGDAPEKWRNACVRNQRWKLVENKELFDLASDPAESRNVIVENEGVANELRGEYDRWFDSVTADGFDPVRISVGAPQENPVTLTQQDWRGPQASWGPDALGAWEIEVAQPGRYDVQLILPKGRPLDSVEVSLGPLKRIVPLEGGLSEVRLMLDEVPAGPARFRAEIAARGKTIGVRFATLRRV